MLQKRSQAKNQTTRENIENDEEEQLCLTKDALQRLNKGCVAKRNMHQQSDVRASNNENDTEVVICDDDDNLNTV